MNKTNTDQWTTRSLLEWMSERFENQSINSPRLISEMLMSHVLGSRQIDLYANIDRIASESELETLRTFVKRTLKNEPVQYIVGKAWFFGAEFNVNESINSPAFLVALSIAVILEPCSLAAFSRKALKI